jgi:hypothetical protein
VRDYVVPNLEGIKFLGLPLHAALKWKKRVAETARKTAGAIDILHWLKHTWWGTDPLILLHFSKPQVRAENEYGSFLIHSLSITHKVLIEKIQLKAFQGAVGLRTSRPADIVLGEAKILPLKIRF